MIVSTANRRAFVFLRHGQTMWNREGRLQGRSDTDLNEVGRSQARDAVRHLDGLGLAVVVTSPLRRAHETAEIVAQALSLPLRVEKRLIERNFGDLEGQLVADIPDRHRSIHGLSASERLPIGAANWSSVRARVRQALDAWLGRHPRGAVLFVSHYGIRKVASAVLLGTPHHYRKRNALCLSRDR